VTISRDDLESKLREIEDVVSETEGEVRSKAPMIIAGVTVVVVLAIAYGVWHSRRRRIRVEVYRIP
jgi:hypothetical protein